MIDLRRPIKPAAGRRRNSSTAANIKTNDTWNLKIKKDGNEREETGENGTKMDCSIVRLVRVSVLSLRKNILCDKEPPYIHQHLNDEVKNHRHDVVDTGFEWFFSEPSDDATKLSRRDECPSILIRRSTTSPATTRTATNKPLRPFQIEQYDGWLASVGLSDSDVEPLKIAELLALADEECLTLWDELSLGYPSHVQGEPRLRTAIATELYPTLFDKETGDSSSVPSAVSIENINCMAPQEGIFCTMHALLKAGDQVVVTGPTYQSLSEIPRSIGCNVEHWLPSIISSKDDVSFFHFDPERLQELLSSMEQSSSSNTTTKLVVVNFPHNPTGALPTQNEWQGIIEICRHYGAYLFCDEMYRGLEHEHVEQLPSVVEVYERGISLSGLSKSFGLAGLRMGSVISRDVDLMKRVQQINDYTTICTSTPSQVLSLIAVRNATTLVERCRDIVGSVRKDVKEFCLENNHFLEWIEPRAGSFILPKLLLLEKQEEGHGVVGGGAREYCDALLKNSDIMLLPSSLFEYGEGHPVDDSRVRISLGRKSIPKHLSRWKEHGF